MKHFLQQMAVLATAAMLSLTVNAQQLTNANFEDWSGAAFDGNVQELHPLHQRLGYH